MDSRQEPSQLRFGTRTTVTRAVQLDEGKEKGFIEEPVLPALSLSDVLQDRLYLLNRKTHRHVARVTR